MVYGSGVWGGVGGAHTDHDYGIWVRCVGGGGWGVGVEGQVDSVSKKKVFTVPNPTPATLMDIPSDKSGQPLYLLL